MFSSADKTYQSASKATDSSRELEASALLKSARLLEACQRRWDAEGRSERLENALHTNQRLWSLFQYELSREDHELPNDVRVNLLRLSKFIDQRTLDVIAQPLPQKLQALIDINRNIAAGLAARSQRAAAV